MLFLMVIVISLLGKFLHAGEDHCNACNETFGVENCFDESVCDNLRSNIKSKRNCWDEVCVIECEEKEVCVIDCGEKCYNYNDTSRCVRNCEDHLPITFPDEKDDQDDIQLTLKITLSIAAVTVILISTIVSIVIIVKITLKHKLKLVRERNVANPYAVGSIVMGPTYASVLNQDLYDSIDDSTIHMAGLRTIYTPANSTQPNKTSDKNKKSEITNKEPDYYTVNYESATKDGASSENAANPYAYVDPIDALQKASQQYESTNQLVPGSLTTEIITTFEQGQKNSNTQYDQIKDIEGTQEGSSTEQTSSGTNLQAPVYSTIKKE